MFCTDSRLCLMSGRSKVKKNYTQGQKDKVLNRRYKQHSCNPEETNYDHNGWKVPINDVNTRSIQTDCLKTSSVSLTGWSEVSEVMNTAWLRDRAITSLLKVSLVACQTPPLLSYLSRHYRGIRANLPAGMRKSSSRSCRENWMMIRPRTVNTAVRGGKTAPVPVHCPEALPCLWNYCFGWSGINLEDVRVEGLVIKTSGGFRKVHLLKIVVCGVLGKLDVACDTWGSCASLWLCMRCRTIFLIHLNIFIPRKNWIKIKQI